MAKASQLIITPLTHDDVLSVGLLFESSISDAFRNEGLGHLQADIHNEVEHKKQMVHASLNTADPDCFFLVAKREGMVAGTISYAPCGGDIRLCTGHQLDEIGEMGSLYVLPRCQGQGVGSALIKELMIYLKKQGIGQFCLDSGYKHAQARWLRKFGEPYRVVKDYWGPGSVHMVWLCKVSDYIF